MLNHGEELSPYIYCIGFNTTEVVEKLLGVVAYAYNPILRRLRQEA
jgi:hypothetical protein